MNITQHLANEMNKNKVHIPLSGVTSYHLLSGNLSLGGAVTTTGMGTFLYTGNTTTLPTINLGMDIQSQWGNVAGETFGYLIEIKSRSAIGSWYYIDSVRGITKAISSDSTAAEVTDANMFTLSTVAGVTTVNIGTSTKTNTNAVTYVMTVWQTTHRTTGITNHAKTFNSHYNPFTGLVIDSYEGSGLAGHEIPHHLGRKLGFVTTKNLSAVTNWLATYSGNENSALYLNLTNANTALATGVTSNTDVSLVVSTDGTANTSTNQYIMYGWANSYFDVANTLIGNYYTYVDANGTLRLDVHTGLSRENVLWQMSKTTLTTGDWDIVDFTRGNTKELNANLSAVESTITANALVKVTSPAVYQRAVDASTLTLNAVVPFANGVDANGTKNTVLTKNETVLGLTLTQGKNYIYGTNAGLYGVKAQAPQYGSYNGFGDYFDVNKNQWYQSPSVYSNDGTVTTGFTAVNGTLVSTNGSLVLTNGTTVIGYAHNLLTITSGKKYRVKLLRSSGNDSWAVKVGTTANGVDTYTSGTQTISGEFTFDFVAVATNYLTVSNITATTGLINTFDNIAIYPINNDGSVDTSSATPITESRNYLDAIVYADAGGQPTFVEQLPKIEYKDIIKAKEYQGKNACTAYIVFDGTTTPPTIKDTFGFKNVIRTATGTFKLYPTIEFDRLDFDLSGSAGESAAYSFIAELSATPRTKSELTIYCASHDAILRNNTNISVHIFGGKN